MDEQQRKEYLSRIIEGNEPLEIPVCDDNGARIGVMRPLTKKHLQSDEIIEKLTNWRNQYKAFFLTQFVATPARTRRWLETVAFSEPTRLLFLIYSEDLLIGHYGFRDLLGDSVLTDNLIRGERSGHPALMRCAVSTVLKWLFDVIQVNLVYGYVFADNAIALKLNRDVGYTFAEILPLRKRVDGDEIKWILGKAGEQNPDNRYCRKLVMMRNPPSIQPAVVAD